MKKSVITLLAVAALGVAVAPALAEESMMQPSSSTVKYLDNAPEGELQAVSAEVVVAEETSGPGTLESKSGASTVTTEAPVVTSLNADGTVVTAVSANAPMVEEKVATPEMVEAGKKEMKPAAKPVAKAATKTAAKALPKTSAVK